MENIKIFVDQQMQNNTYLIINQQDVIIIDPSFSTRRIIEFINNNNYVVKAILLTHGHYDHFAGVDILGDLFQCDYYISEEDESFLHGYDSKIFKHALQRVPKYYPDHQLKIASFNIDILKTPGHSPGSVVLVWGDSMFTGDFLFAGDIGRTDLSGGSVKQMQLSLAYFKTISLDYVIYPGHEESSTLKKEKLTNPYLK